MSCNWSSDWSKHNGKFSVCCRINLMGSAIYAMNSRDTTLLKTKSESYIAPTQASLLAKLKNKIICYNHSNITTITKSTNKEAFCT